MPENNLRVLVALSDFVAAENVCSVLSSRGIFQIVNVESTQQAVDAMLDTRFNLFIVDARVPVTLSRTAVLYGGIDHIRFIRMCEGPMSEATVVFLRTKSSLQNALESRAEIVSAYNAGADCVLPLPFTDEKFDSEIIPIITKPRRFIRERSYTGPCRRRTDVPVRCDRRRGE